jgi:hypothetical protein
LILLLFGEHTSLIFSQGELHSVSRVLPQSESESEIKTLSRRIHISRRRLMEIDKLLARTENLYWRAPKSGMLSAVGEYVPLRNLVPHLDAAVVLFDSWIDAICPAD